MNNPHRASIAAAVAAALVAPAEGLRHYVYADPVGIPTYCFGETAHPVAGKFYSTAECQALLTDGVAVAVATVDKCAPGAPDNVLGAFGSAVYNIGPTIACDRTNSTAARYLWNHQWIDACNQLPLWNKSHLAGALVTLPGLTTRRDNERAYCLKGLS
jgi:GH24 family phage-related lysozyme (muramidase)